MTHCNNCGGEVTDDSATCGDCQPEIMTDGGQSSGSDQAVAGILALLLGGVGAHKFYQGNTKIGLIYLCLFWTAIPAMLAFIEGILILVADEDEYHQKYADGSILGR